MKICIHPIATITKTSGLNGDVRLRPLSRYFEEHIETVHRIVAEIDGVDKPVIMVFNKIDAYTYIKKDEDDLSPFTEVNYTLEDWKKKWFARQGYKRAVFISAGEKQNIDELKQTLYDVVAEIHAERFPYNNFLF